MDAQPTVDTAQAFAGAPRRSTAYVKPVDKDGTRMYAIHDQYGTAIAMAPSRDVAFAFLTQRDVEALDVH